MLTGKYLDATPEGSRAEHEKKGKFLRARFTDTNIEKVRRLTPIAAELGIPMSTLALSWCLRRIEVSSCIVGASRPEQILENAKAVDFDWDDSIESRIEAILA
jgi:aryl-alcohol dehydrogenase-like predicted oxidoreductase